ncbi:hypothetical protein JXO52_06215 [bacterium]|nr:hypothetical protein [bacterium]
MSKHKKIFAILFLFLFMAIFTVQIVYAVNPTPCKDCGDAENCDEGSGVWGYPYCSWWIDPINGQPVCYIWGNFGDCHR